MRVTMLLFLFACSENPTESSPPEESAADDSTPPDQLPVLAEHVAAIPGQWSGSASPTPIGDVPFAIAFDADGGKVAGDTKQAGFAFEFAFDPDDKVGFRFTETGKFGGFTQSHVLIPDEIAADRVRWIDVEDPDVLAVTTEVSDERFVMDAWVRGKRHATIDMTRL